MAAVNPLCVQNLQGSADSPESCRGRCLSQPFATKERYGCGSAACRYTSARQFAPFLRKSPANSRLPKGPTESSAPTTTLALSCRGGRLCPPADRTGFYGNLRRIRGCPAGRCGHRPLHDSGKFVLPRKFRMQGVFTAIIQRQLLSNLVYRNRRRVPNRP